MMSDEMKAIKKKELEERVKNSPFAKYDVRPGEGADIFDDWNEWAPDFLDRCSVPDPEMKGEGKRDGEDKERSVQDL